jgi:hypothetical protein
MQPSYKHSITSGEKSSNPGESGRATGQSPSGIVNIGEGGTIDKFPGLLKSPAELLSSVGLKLGEAVAPARS